MSGSIPLDAPEVKDELTRYLEESDAWNMIIDKEVDGNFSIPYQKDKNEYMVEIVQHLGNLEGSDVRLELSVEVDVPNGISSEVMRIVHENCKTEKIDDYRFDE